MSVVTANAPAPANAPANAPAPAPANAPAPLAVEEVLVVPRPPRKTLAQAPKWKPSRNLLNARTRKLRNVFKSNFPKNEFTMNVPSPTNNLYRGPICDPIGYSQHGGECWSDTLQQLILFSDGLKEYTQPFFYNTPYSEIEARIDRFVDADFAPILKKYVKAMQVRFISHYNLLVTGNPDFETCVEAPDYRSMIAISSHGTSPISAEHKLYRQRSLIMSLEAARSVVGWDKETSGAGRDQYELIYSSLIQLLDAGFSIRLKEHASLTGDETILGYLGLTTNYHIKEYSFSDDKNNPQFLVKIGNGHASGFLKCNNKFFFYDDNTGLFETGLPFSEIGNVRAIHVKTDHKDLIRKAFLLKGILTKQTYLEDNDSMKIFDGKVWSGSEWKDFDETYLLSSDNSVLMALNGPSRYAIVKELYPGVIQKPPPMVMGPAPRVHLNYANYVKLAATPKAPKAPANRVGGKRRARRTRKYRSK